MSRSPGLGRGLSALFGEVAQEQPVGGGSPADGVRIVPVTHLRPHPNQPRRRFDDAAMAELAESIRRRGLIQPVLVRPHGSGFLQIVAGERRWRAAQAAGLHEIPVIVRTFDEVQTLEVAIVENVQREDLNAIEEAEAYQRLSSEFGHSHDDIAGFVGKSRSHVANLIRLLALPQPVRDAVAKGALSMGHARALINAPDAEILAAEAVRRGLSVREVEALARGGVPAKRPRSSAPPAAIDDDSAALARRLADLLGVKVSVTHMEGAGEVVLSYGSLDQLDMICQRLSGGTI